MAFVLCQQQQQQVEAVPMEVEGGVNRPCLDLETPHIGYVDAAASLVTKRLTKKPMPPHLKDRRGQC